MFDPTTADSATSTEPTPRPGADRSPHCDRRRQGPRDADRHLHGRMERLEAARSRIAGESSRADSTAVESCVEAIGAAVAGVGSVDWRTTRTQASIAAVLELAAAHRNVEVLLAEGLEHLERSGATLAEHGLAAPAWLSHEMKCSRSSAKRLVQLGRTLARFEGFALAIKEGRLSTDHAMALHAVSNPRIAELLVDAEPTLLEMALETSFAAFRRNLRIIANRLDADGAEPDCSDVDELSLSTDAQGGLHLRGRLSGHQATAFSRALRNEYDRQWRSASTEHGRAGAEIPTPAVLRARALVEVVRRGLGSDPASAERPRCDAVIVVEHDTVLDRHTVRTDDGEPLDAVTAAVLACDAYLQPLVIDPDTNTPLFVGRASRYATREQRRALMVRDGGCVFPGCDAPASWCDAHHVIPWDQGGTTDIDNLALLCRRHHGYAHSNRWVLEAIPLDDAADAEGPPPPGAVRLVWHGPRGTVDAQQGRRRRSAPAH